MITRYRIYFHLHCKWKQLRYTYIILNEYICLLIKRREEGVTIFSSVCYSYVSSCENNVRCSGKRLLRPEQLWPPPETTIKQSKPPRKRSSRAGSPWLRFSFSGQQRSYFLEPGALSALLLFFWLVSRRWHLYILGPAHIGKDTNTNRKLLEETLTFLQKLKL